MSCALYGCSCTAGSDRDYVRFGSRAAVQMASHHGRSTLSNGPSQLTAGRPSSLGVLTQNNAFTMRRRRLTPRPVARRLPLGRQLSGRMPRRRRWPARGNRPRPGHRASARPSTTPVLRVVPTPGAGTVSGKVNPLHPSLPTPRGPMADPQSHSRPPQFCALRHLTASLSAAPHPAHAFS